MKIELLLLLSPFVPIGLLFIAILLYDKSCKKKIDIITSLFLQLEARIDKLEAECNARLAEQQNLTGFLEHNYDIIARSYNDLSARFEKIEAYIFTNPKPEDFGIEAESVTTKNKE